MTDIALIALVFGAVVTGTAPCGVDEERFIDAWTDLHYKALHLNA